MLIRLALRYECIWGSQIKQYNQDEFFYGFFNIYKRTLREKSIFCADKDKIEGFSNFSNM